MSEKNGYYVFGAINNNQEKTFRTIELGGIDTNVHTIPYEEQALVVAEAPLMIYKPNKENISTHQQVLEQVMGEHTVIPFSFGTLFKTKEDCAALHSKLYSQFADIFPIITGKIEVGLKLIADKEWLTELVESNAQLVKARDNANQKSYYDQLALGEKAKQMMASLQDQIEQELVKPLEEIAVGSKVNEGVSERMLLNASFLVPKEKEQEFDDKINELHEQWKDKMTFKYTGPWPPYNFTNLKLKVKES